VIYAHLEIKKFCLLDVVDLMQVWFGSRSLESRWYWLKMFSWGSCVEN